MSQIRPNHRHRERSRWIAGLALAAAAVSWGCGGPTSANGDAAAPGPEPEEPKEPAIAIAASIARWGAIFGGLSRDDDDGGGIIGLLVLAIVAPIAATIIQLAISRSREYHADATGASFIGDPEALASALAKLERGNERVHFHSVGDTPATASLFICSPLSGKSVRSWFSTHPPMAERIKRLHAMR